MIQAFQLMNLATPPDGILTMSDRIAFSAMHALKQREIRIPEDLAVVSFNNAPPETIVLNTQLIMRE